jgi:hypothetical protein
MPKSRWIAGLVATWVFLQGLATIWPAFSQRTIPQWLAARMPAMSGGILGWASLIVGVAILALLVWERFRKPSSNAVEPSTWNKSMEVIDSRTFTNKEVELDGRVFESCRFVNVTLVYNGRGPCAFVDPKFVGTIELKKPEHEGLEYFADLRQILEDEVPGFKSFDQGDKNRITNSPKKLRAVVGAAKVRAICQSLMLRGQAELQKGVQQSADAWISLAAEFVRDNFGETRAARFLSDEGLPAPILKSGTPLQKQINGRIVRLSEIIAEAGLLEAHGNLDEWMTRLGRK